MLYESLIVAEFLINVPLSTSIFVKIGTADSGYALVPMFLASRVFQEKERPDSPANLQIFCYPPPSKKQRNARAPQTHGCWAFAVVHLRSSHRGTCLGEAMPWSSRLASTAPTSSSLSECSSSSRGVFRKSPTSLSGDQHSCDSGSMSSSAWIPRTPFLEAVCCTPLHVDLQLPRRR